MNNIFLTLRKRVEWEKRNLSFIETAEDRNIVLMIGQFQKTGYGIFISDLRQTNIGSAATIERRVARLKKLDVIREVVGTDRRYKLLRLSPKVMRLFDRYEKAWY